MRPRVRRGGRVHRAPRDPSGAVQAINESYMPSAEEIAHAHRVVAAFESAPGSARWARRENDRHPAPEASAGADHYGGSIRALKRAAIRELGPWRARDCIQRDQIQLHGLQDVGQQILRAIEMPRITRESRVRPIFHPCSKI